MIDFQKLQKISQPNTVAVVGVPSDENSSYLKGTAEAPQIIIEALHNDSSNMCTENGIDLSKDDRLIELGSLDFTDNINQALQIEKPIVDILKHKVKLISLGGDHSISYPLIKAHSSFHKDITVLHIDAHPDLYHKFEGNQFSHASPFARIMEEKLVKRLISVGIRTMTPHQQEQADKFSVEIIEMNKWSNDLSIELNSPVYISLDLDVLDPGFAPGISHYEPGGCSPRDVINLIQKINCPVIGADIVEHIPQRDLNGMTAMTAAKFLKEIVSKMI